ncbi:6-carboxytetrahydropterin synthase QueD [Desulfosporosinus hippei]|uniref:6-carboxy-5,6,7,8-tetrahydropterin synthase n=1 Tax=Desulfosporosinus hippei DSM 8344 TaxID=1121419 RepID=A0A1G7XL28_9FIRM|nr:6-carboxytetrahydropterin synthase QueD [Desulfosporosinus hippei]SDG84743.1 6-pyruvoyltetrahydropterin/6-carboxytetrahydropterin synthase [Desulfosporosinus hippei DSM 8344]
MFQVCVRAHFDAAHYIRDYDGDCSNLHGHRWDIEVCISGEKLDHLGMLIDFKEIKQAIRKEVKLLDHCLLNDLTPFGASGVNPTAENLARYLFLEFKEALSLQEKRLAWVKVFESPDTWAIFRED